MATDRTLHIHRVDANGQTLIYGESLESTTIGFGERHKPGWYFLTPADEDSVGPFDSSIAAEAAGVAAYRKAFRKRGAPVVHFHSSPMQEGA